MIEQVRQVHWKAMILVQGNFGQHSDLSPNLCAKALPVQ